MKAQQIKVTPKTNPALFSRCSVTGPQGLEDLASQLAGAGMTAAAWLLNEFQDEFDELQARVDTLEYEALGEDRLEDLEAAESFAESVLDALGFSDPEDYADALEALADLKAKAEQETASIFD